MKAKSQNAQIRGFLKSEGFYPVSGDRRSTEYGHNTAKIVVQILHDKDGQWAILTDDFMEIASGSGFTGLKRRFDRAIKKAA